MMSNVIIFGATGAVGSAAAIEASERDAKVWLAMRDTNKMIKTISEEEEKNGSFTRVQADLTDSESITKAVKESGAKAAFIYGIWEAKDHMRSAIQALKDAGITWIVFLSSYTIMGDKRKVTPDEVIPYMHAQIEITLEEVGVPFAAVRPGSFATNEYRSKSMFQKGFYVHPYPEIKFDHIDPKNIGQLAGALLVKPQDLKPSEPEIVYLMGPQLTSVQDSTSMIGKVIDKDIKLNVITPEEWSDGLKQHIPEPIAKYLARGVVQMHENPDMHAEMHKEASQNLQKYTGKQPTKLADWLEANKHEFLA